MPEAYKKLRKPVQARVREEDDLIKVDNLFSDD